MRAVDVRDTVEAGQPLVQERVVRRQQLLDRPVLAHLALEEQLGLALEEPAQVVVEFGKRARVGVHGPQVPHEQPLAAEILRQRRRTRVAQHPPDLPLQDARVPERAARRDIEQFIVRDAAPQEERQAGRQLQVADRIHAMRRDVDGVAFDAEQEFGGNQ